MTIETPGELRKALANLPDDTKVATVTGQKPEDITSNMELSMELVHFDDYGHPGKLQQGEDTPETGGTWDVVCVDGS